MKKYDVVIIGGGPAGAACANSARNTYPDKTVALIRKEPIALIPCGIPYTLSSLDSVDQNILGDGLITKSGTDLIIDEVVGRQGDVLVMKSGDEVSFEKLVLATGSTPVIPPIDGIDKKGVFMVSKDYDYLGMMRQAVEKAQNIVIIGGGYIGVEVADEVLKAGKNVTLIEMLDSLLETSMDAEFGEVACQVLRDRGATVHLGSRVQSIAGNERVDTVEMAGGTKIPADMVIFSVGSRPNLELARTFDVDFKPDRGILVNEYLRTSDPDVFAIGDCAAKHDFFTGEFSGIMLASTAMAEGRLAGSNLFGIKVLRQYMGVLGSFSTKIGDTAFGVSGITESTAKRLGIEYVVGQSTAPDRHPGVLPGASKTHVKLLFSRYCHNLIGVQIYGGDSVGEMVNTFAVMILNKMTDMDIDTMQIGTHPLLTASPLAYPALTATVDSIVKWSS